MALIEKFSKCGFLSCAIYFFPVALPSAPCPFYRPRNTQNKIACNSNANGSAPTSNSQPPHAMGKLFGTNLRQIISANWALKNLGI